MAVTPLPDLRLGRAGWGAPEPVRHVLDRGRRYSLWVFDLGLACCAVEFVAASMTRPELVQQGVAPSEPVTGQAEVMVVAGTVTDKMAPAVRRLYDEMPGPAYVIAFGACATCGGPYWDSYCVTKGVDQIIPVDVYVPGCPPRPEALLHGLDRLEEKITAETAGDTSAGARPSTGRPRGPRESGSPGNAGRR